MFELQDIYEVKEIVGMKKVGVSIFFFNFEILF